MNHPEGLVERVVEEVEHIAFGAAVQRGEIRCMHRQERHTLRREGHKDGTLLSWPVMSLARGRGRAASVGNFPSCNLCAYTYHGKCVVGMQSIGYANCVQKRFFANESDLCSGLPRIFGRVSSRCSLCVNKNCL